MIIDHQPRFVQVFMRWIDRGLSQPQRRHLWGLLLAVLVNPAGSKVIHWCARLPRFGHRTSHGRFLSESCWDEAALLNDQVMRLLRRCRLRRGEVVDLIIDEIRIPKRGRKMELLSKYYHHIEHRQVYGHIVVVGAILFRGVMLPWRIELWKSRAWCETEEFRKLTEIAAKMIRSLDLPVRDVRVRVLVDAFYLCPTVTHACEERGFAYFSVAKRNRRFAQVDRGTRRGNRSTHIGQLLPGLVRHQGQNVRLKRSFGWRWMRIASVTGHLRGIGMVRLVGSHRAGMPWRECLPIVTNRLTLKARDIVSIYERRFRIELLFKELQSHLGLREYQVLSRQAIARHLHLCALAHLLLTHHAMDGIGAQARKANTDVALPPISLRLAAVRDEIRREQLARLFKGERHARLRARITPYLMAA